MEREERERMEIVACEGEDNWMVESDGAARRDGCGGRRSAAAAALL